MHVRLLTDEASSEVRRAAAAVPPALPRGRQPDRELHLRQGAHRSLRRRRRQHAGLPHAARQGARLGADAPTTCATCSRPTGPTSCRSARTAQFAIDNALLDQILGGWSASGIVRIQTGRPFLLTSGRQTLNQQDAGVVLNGITVEELQNDGQRPARTERQRVYCVRRSARSAPTAARIPSSSRRRRPRASRASTSTSTVRASGTRISASRRTSGIGGQRASTSRRCSSTRSTTATRLVGGTGGATLSIDSTTFGQSTTVAIGARQIQFRLGFYF